MTVVYLVVAAVVAVALTYLVIRVRANSVLNETRSKLSQTKEEIRNKKGEAEAEIRNKKGEAEAEIRNKKRELELEKKEKFQQLREDFDKETKEEKEELHNLSKRLTVREESLDGRLQEIEKGKERIEKREQEFTEERKEISTLKKECREELERTAGISANEAKKELLDAVKKEAQQEVTQIIRKIEQEAKETANKKAREIVATAIQRCAVDEVTERVISTITLPNDEMKGRVIGKEGRNIKTFEALTGVDVLVDDTPGTVTISCFDPVRREIAKLSLKRLIADGRIQPGRIEDVVEKSKKEIGQIIHDEGQRITLEMGISDLDSEIVNLLGRLKYRTSYGQNVLQHSKEVAIIAGMMAAEMKANVPHARRAGLLHDLGKAVSKESNSSHASDGAELAKRYGESSEIVHAIAAHHEDEPIDTILAMLVQAADAISAGRPGARREDFEAYLKRIEELEKIAYSFEGVKNAYAIRSGRELRIMVEPERINDEESRKLSGEIAGRIEGGELKYPGQIRVTVIRELRSTDYAK